MSRISGYQKSFNKYGEDVRSLQWKDSKSAEIRYKQIVKDIDFNGKTILDVGCGFGDLIPFISAKTSNFDYTGIDITPEFVDIAIKKYPDQKFLKGDYFANPLSQKFDVVITSGTLNFVTDDPYSRRGQMIKTMWEWADSAVIFNMAGGYPQPKAGKRVFYADTLRILEFCYKLTPKLILRNNYHKKDFTVILFK